MKIIPQEPKTDKPTGLESLDPFVGQPESKKKFLVAQKGLNMKDRKPAMSKYTTNNSLQEPRPEEFVPAVEAAKKMPPGYRGHPKGETMRNNGRISQLTDRFNLPEYINQVYGTNLPTNRNSGAVRAPYRQDTHPSLSLFRRNGVWFWKDFATGKGGNAYQFLRDVMGLSVAEAIRVMEAQIGQVDYTPKRPVPRPQPQPTQADLDAWKREEGRLLLWLVERQEELKAKGLPERLTRRGLGLADAVELELGRMGEALVMPIWGPDGSLSAVKLGFPRNSERRYQYHTRGRGTPPWFSRNFEKAGRVLVVEGELNAMVAYRAMAAYHVAAVGMAGANTLLPDPTVFQGKQVFVTGDPDIPGHQAMLMWASQLAEAGVEVYVVQPIDRQYDLCELAEMHGLESVARSLSGALMSVEQGYGMDGPSAEALNRMYHDPYGCVPFPAIKQVSHPRAVDTGVALYMALLEVVMTGGCLAARKQADGSFLFLASTTLSYLLEKVGISKKLYVRDAIETLKKAGLVLEYHPATSRREWGQVLFRVLPLDEWNSELMEVNGLGAERNRLGMARRYAFIRRNQQEMRSLPHWLRAVIAYMRHHDNRASLEQLMALTGMTRAGLISGTIYDHPALFGIVGPVRDVQSVLYLKDGYGQHLARWWKQARQLWQARLHIPAMLNHLNRFLNVLTWVVERGYARATDRWAFRTSTLLRAIHRRAAHWLTGEALDRVTQRLERAKHELHSILGGVAKNAPTYSR